MSLDTSHLIHHLLCPHYLILCRRIHGIFSLKLALAGYLPRSIHDLPTSGPSQLTDFEHLGTEFPPGDHSSPPPRTVLALYLFVGITKYRLTLVI